MTNPFGYYALEDLRAKVMYRLYLVSKTHRFDDRIVLLDENLNSVNFVGTPVYGEIASQSKRH